MISCDFGTMNLVCGRIDEFTNSVSFERERNVFAEVRDTLNDPEEILKNNNYSYIKIKDKLFVVGEDVFRIHAIESLFNKTGSQQSYFSQVRRTMQNGIINTSEEKMSISILQEITKRLLGKPRFPNEVCCFCAPGDSGANNVTFHRMMLTNFIRSLGYTPECINEAVAIVLSECPICVSDSDPNEISKFSGISFSFGSGLANCALVYKQLPLLTFSIESGGGDWIDEQSAQVVGTDRTSVTRFKEKFLDLDNIDPSNFQQTSLEIFYDAQIEHVIKTFAQKFEKLDNKISMPLEIVIAGGGSMVPGFLNKFKSVISRIDLPFQIKDIKLASQPLFAVSHGCLCKAISVEQKMKAQSAVQDPKPEEPAKKPERIKIKSQE